MKQPNLHNLALAITLIDQVNALIAKIVVWLLGAAAILIALLVILRTSISWNSIALQELGLYFHAAVLMLLMPFALKTGAHVRVDIFYQRFSRKSRAWVDATTILMLVIPFACFLIVIGWQPAAQSWKVLEGSNHTGGIPAVFLLKTLAPLTGALLFLQGLSQVFKAYLQITNTDTTRTSHSHVQNLTSSEAEKH